MLCNMYVVITIFKNLSGWFKILITFFRPLTINIACTEGNSTAPSSFVIIGSFPSKHLKRFKMAETFTKRF